MGSSLPVNEASRYSRHANSQEYVKSKKLKKKKSRRKRVALIALALVAVLGLGGACAAWAYVSSIEGNLHDGLDDDLLNSLTVSDSPSDPFYMLLIGVDKSQERESEYGGSYRTDSMMLARVDPKNKKVTMVSIHRDTRVTLAGHGQQKINAAYAYGGAAGAVKAVSELAGVDINHYAEIDFDGFKDVVNALGGVEVDVPMEIDDDMAGGHVDAGVQTLNGEEALILCRSRHAYDNVAGDGDSMRAANQRLVLLAIMKKIMSSDVGTLTNTVSTLADYITTDFSIANIVGFAQALQGIDVENDVYSAMQPTTSVYENNTWWETTNETEWKKMMSRVDQGLPPTEETVVDSKTGVTLSQAGDGGSASSSSTSSSASSNSLNLSGTKVAVKNGSGISGCASAAAGKLTPYGAVVETGNADDFSYSTTLVIYNNSSQAATAEAIAKELGVGTAKKNTGTYSFTADYLVVVGADWK